MNRRLLIIGFATVALATLGSAPAEAATIIGISTPVGSNDASSYPLDENVWSLGMPGDPPLNIGLGIGHMIDPNVRTDNANYVKHDHQYPGDVPDPSRAQVTYRFDQPTIVDGLDLVEHQNGVTMIQAYIGDALGSFVPVGGPITGSLGAPASPTPGFFTNYTDDFFSFANATPATYFRFVITETSLDAGYAFFAAFPEQTTVPEPASLALGGLALGALATRRRRPR